MKVRRHVAPSALLAMALFPGLRPRKPEAAPPTPVEPRPIPEPESRQQRRARERREWKRGAR